MKFVKADITRSSTNSSTTSSSGQYSSSSSGGVSYSGSATLTTHNIWGQPFDGTQDVAGDMTNVDSITATGNISTDGQILIKQVDSEGNVVNGNDLIIGVDGNKATFTGKTSYSFGGDVTATSFTVDKSLYVNSSGTNMGGTILIGSTLNGNQATDSMSITVDSTTAYFKNKQKYKFDTDISCKDLIADTNISCSGTATLPTIKSDNITNTDTIKTKNLEVTGSAHFFELIIDKIKAAGGAVLFTPADGFDIDIVEADGTSGYKLYWQCQDGNGKQRDNMWKVNDQALCMSFNQAKVGTSHSVNNKYYWALVTAVSDSTQPVLKDGEYYNWITISSTDCDGTVNPEKGDSIVMCGYRGTDDTTRQSAIYISAYSSLDSDLTAPLYATYRGINDFNLSSHRKSYFDANKAKFVGDFSTESGTTFDDVIKKVDSVSSSPKIKTVQQFYYLSEKNTGITVDNITGTWSTDYIKPTATFKYLWSFTKYTYEDNSTLNSTPTIVAEYLEGTSGKDAEYYYVEYIKKRLSVYVDDDNTNGILKCAIQAYIYKVKGDTRQLQTDKGLSLDFYNSKDTLVESHNAETSDTYLRTYINDSLQTDYLNNSNQILYCLAQTYDLT